jgi:hypothetical protein
MFESRRTTIPGIQRQLRENLTREGTATTSTAGTSTGTTATTDVVDPEPAHAVTNLVDVDGAPKLMGRRRHRPSERWAPGPNNAVRPP